MAKTDTIQPVARPRGELSDEQREHLEALQFAVLQAQIDYRETVVEYLEWKGVSFSALSEATGLSTNTLQRWKREAGK